MSITADAVDAFLTHQADEAQLDALYAVTKKRRDALDVIRMSSIKVGDQVVTAHIKPKYYAGLRGTLTAITSPRRGRQGTVIRLDEASTERLRKHEWIPDGATNYEVDVIPLNAVYLDENAAVATSR